MIENFEVETVERWPIAIGAAVGYELRHINH